MSVGVRVGKADLFCNRSVGTPQSKYPAVMKCMQCGEPDLVRGVRVVDRGEDNRRRDLCLEVELDPGAFFNKDEFSAPVSASICRSCGNVMFSLEPHLLNDFCDVAEITKKYGDFKKHPRFEEFVEENSYRRVMGIRDLMREFLKWLRWNDPEDKISK